MNSSSFHGTSGPRTMSKLDPGATTRSDTGSPCVPSITKRTATSSSFGPDAGGTVRPVTGGTIWLGCVDVGLVGAGAMTVPDSFFDCAGTGSTISVFTGARFGGLAGAGTFGASLSRGFAVIGSGVAFGGALFGASFALGNPPGFGDVPGTSVLPGGGAPPNGAGRGGCCGSPSGTI